MSTSTTSATRRVPLLLADATDPRRAVAHVHPFAPHSNECLPPELRPPGGCSGFPCGRPGAQEGDEVQHLALCVGWEGCERVPLVVAPTDAGARTAFHGWHDRSGPVGAQPKRPVDYMSAGFGDLNVGGVGQDACPGGARVRRAPGGRGRSRSRVRASPSTARSLLQFVATP